MIRKLASGKYRLYSRKKNPKTGKLRNLGTFRSRAAAERHERAVQFFKRAWGTRVRRASPRAAHQFRIEGSRPPAYTAESSPGRGVCFFSDEVSAERTRGAGAPVRAQEGRDDWTARVAPVDPAVAFTSL